MLDVIPPAFILPFTTTLVFFLIVERFLHAAIIMFIPSMEKGANSTQTELLIGSCIQFFATVISNTVSLVFRIISGLFGIFTWLLLLMMVLSVVYVSYEEYPSMWVYIVRFYNIKLSPFIQYFVIVPLQLLNIFFKMVIPLFNMGIWFYKRALNQGLLPLMIQEFTTLIRMSSCVLMFCRHIVTAFQVYVGQLECVNDICLAIPPRFDLTTPLTDVRNLGVMLVEIGQNICTPLNIPMSILVYPLLDVYFAQCVECLWNAFLQAIAQIFVVTLRRCSVSKGNLMLACTPDIEPLFLEVIHGLKWLGKGVDAWIQFVLRIVLGGGPCISTTTSTETPSMPAFSSFMEGELSMTGLGSSTIGVTNGSLAMFYDYTTYTSVFRSWSESGGSVRSEYGIASVYYSSADLERSTMLGCNCSNTVSDGVLIQCNYLRGNSGNSASGGSSSGYVSFTDSTWKQVFTCENVEISVRTVRFSVRRFDASTDPSSTLDCITRNTCENIDATVWLVPKCNLIPSAVCNPMAIGTNCYPFCMATRVSGSMNSPLVFVNAQAWRSGKQVLYQECIVASTSILGKMRFTSQSASSSCQSNARGNSVVFLLANASDSATELSSYIRGGFQPFAITGETILVSATLGDGTGVVYVERLTGNQQDVYSLVKSDMYLEAAPRQNIPVKEFKYNPLQQVYIPLEFQARRIHAVSSEKYVFYAQSPNLELFGAFFDYCRDTTKLPQFQFMIFSSYSPLRIYRIRAYCQKNCIQISTQYTFQGFTDPSNLSQSSKIFQCNPQHRFNASFQGIEYVNPNNIAVMVQEADMSYNSWTDTGITSQYKIYWLNPETMQVRSPEQGMWQDPLFTGSSISNERCPAIIPGFPLIGRWIGSSISSMAFLIRFFANFCLYTPGLIKQWQDMGTNCPSNALGHYTISTCGRYVYSLDDYFDALEDCSGIVWNSLIFLSDVIGGGKTAELTTMQQILHGLSAYGFAMNTGATASVEGMLNTPIMENLKGIFMIIRTQNVANGIGTIGASASAWVRFGYIFMHDVVVNMVRTILTSETITWKIIWLSFTNSVYELREAFSSIVIVRGESGCLGISIMFGGNNPIAGLMYHVCMSSQQLVSSLFRLFTVLFVEVPVVKCVCVDASLFNSKQYILTTCIPAAPSGMKSDLIDLLHLDTCSYMVKSLEKSLSNNFHGWFSEIYQALDALSSSIDYAMIGLDSDAGQCLNYQNNPNVVVIIPEPIDYFQACSTTVSCHSKCSGTWDLFQQLLLDYSTDDLKQSITIANTVESMFFPYAVEEIVTLGDVIALSQLMECKTVCGSSSSQCIVVMFSQGITKTLIRQHFCIPPDTVSSVSFGLPVRWLFDYSSLCDSIVKGYFLFQDGSSLVFSCMKDSLMLLYQVTPYKKTSETLLLIDPSIISSYLLKPLLLQGLRSMQVVDFLVVKDRVVASLGVRVTVNGKYESQKACLFLYPNGNSSSLCSFGDELWKGYSISERRSTDETNSISTSSDLILWPGSNSVSSTAYHIRLTWGDTDGLQLKQIQTLKQDDSLVTRYSMLPQTLILSKYFMEDSTNILWTAYACDPAVTYDWLYQLRILYSDPMNTIHTGTLYNSQTIASDITIVANCDGLDCRGCPNSQLRSVCMAYQSCSIFKCVGTPVNLNRPLCNVGGLLKTFGTASVVALEGGYMVFCQLFLAMTHVGQTDKGRIAWPDESFFGYVCNAKDMYAEIASTLTSTVNAIVQLSQSHNTQLQQMQNLDSNVNIARSFSVTSLTAFLYQLMLWPIYTLTVARTILVCNVQGFLSVFSVGKLDLTIVSTRFEDATGAISGVCMTTYEATQALQTGEAAIKGNFANEAGKVVTNAATTFVRLKIEPIMHTLDGILSYIAGAIYKFGDVLKSFNLKKCLIPNILASEVVQCACGDTSVMIPEARARNSQGWCTGTIFLARADGSLRPVYNPYSFQELKLKLSDTVYSKYLLCLEKFFNCTVPNDDIFLQQGCNLVQVLNKCRQNYVQQTMDGAAYLMYDQTLLNSNIMVSGLQSKPVDTLGKCLLYAYQHGYTNEACFTDLVDSDPFFWKYETITNPGTSSDGCIAMSGPSKVDNRFKNCLQDYQLPGVCEFSGHLWSPASTNSVPVAFPHIIQDLVFDSQTISDKFKQAWDMVVPLLHELENFNDEELDVGLFSAEGDLLHQMLDCIYLGPYARTDYWPQLHGFEELQGLYWSRDENKGKNRGIDINTCSKTDSLPYTCGSPNRKAMMKYFVNNVILGNGGKKNQIINEFIRQEIKDLFTRWVNLDSYWDYSNETYLPLGWDRTGTDMYFNTTNILATIEKKLAILWNESMFMNIPWIDYLDEVASDEKAKYNWTIGGNAHWVVEEARYDTTIPTTDFSGEEAMTPPQSFLDTSLWMNCHGALKQVIFTMPTENFPAFPGGGPEAIEAYITTITQQAFAKSPLYRHYNVKHKPSMSKVCVNASKNTEATRTVAFDDFLLENQIVFPGDSLNSQPVLGFHTGGLGQAKSLCFCGWQPAASIKFSEGLCIAPPSACQDISWLGPDCSFSKSETLNVSLLYKTTWYCPLWEVSEHFGFLDREATESWIQNNYQYLSSSSEEVLRYGTGGFRVGNSGKLGQVWKNQVDPTQDRVYTPEEDGMVYGCEAEDFTRTDDLRTAEAFVETLFPMSQGIGTSGVESYCLRFFLEWSKYQVLYMMDSNETAQQQSTAQLWKRRCGSQVQLLALCKSLNMFQPNDYTSVGCSHLWRIESPSSGSYITPQCLVYVQGKFYDPCACDPGKCTSYTEVTYTTISETWLVQSCHAVFNPVTMVLDQEFGWWDVDNSDPISSLSNEWLQDSYNLFDADLFVYTMLSEDKLFNTQLGDWISTEGYMRDTSTFCDYIEDYWVDESIFPVGYFVSMPCMQEDIGYRSYDNVFAYDTDPITNEPILRYLEDQTRDKQSLDSRFGSGGICRLSNYGFDMYETNTMRVCTRVSSLEHQVDIHVPNTFVAGGLNESDPDAVQCSDSSHDLPWTDDTSTIQSVGVVPNLPLSGTKYPQSFFQVGNIHKYEQEHGWGSSCDDFQIPSCLSNSDCPDLFKCFHQVCVDASVACFSHQDCQGNTLCNGLGECVDPILSVWNDHNVTVEFKSTCTDCDFHSSYSMQGASHWAYVPDLLEAHGMCSYRHWREYLHTFDTCTCTSTSMNDVACKMDASNCTYYNFMLPQNPVKWWQTNTTAPNRLKLIPTTCDRDYERMRLDGQELRYCYPTSNDNVLFLQPSGRMYNQITRSSMVRTYDISNQQTYVRYMPFKQNTTYGFLGNVENIQTCGTMKQCYADDFYVNGKITITTDKQGLKIPKRLLLNNKNYSGEDIFQCGFMGYMEQGFCHLDLKLFPLYVFFCKTKPIPDECTNAVDTQLVGQICDNILEVYSPSYAIITGNNMAGLINLFYAFNDITGLVAHLYCVECLNFLFQKMQNNQQFYGQNLYYPLAFTVYEFPITWLYQCIIGSSPSIPPLVFTTQRVFPCSFFTGRIIHPSQQVYTTLSASDPFRIYMARVQGGYNATQVNNYLDQQVLLAQQQWIDSITRVKVKYFGGTNTIIAPSCYKKRKWNIDGADLVQRYLIYINIRGMCDNTFNNKIRERYNIQHPNNVINSITEETEKLTTKLDRSFQYDNPTDLLGVIQEWGVHYILQDSSDIEQYVRSISRGATDTNPVSYHVSMPEKTDVVVSQDLLYQVVGARENTYTIPYSDPNAIPVDDRCADQDRVQIFWDDTEADMQAIRVCPICDTGFFSCSYPVYSVANTQYSYDWNDVSNGKGISDYFLNLYDLVLTEFKTHRTTPSSLPVLPLPFFEQETPAYSPSNFVFDILAVKTYEHNMNPDYDVALMCVLGENKINFTQCTNPHYLAMQDHVQKNYVKPGPVTIPAYEQMDWKVTKNLFLKGSVFSFAEKERALDRTHLMAWLNNENVCNGDNVNINDRMCQYTPERPGSSVQVPKVVSPWTLGYWNPGEKCDVTPTDIMSGYQEVIDVYCYLLEYCPLNSENQPDITSDYYQKMPFFDSAKQEGCRYKQNKQASSINVRDDVGYNLCRGNKFNDDEVCFHTQSMVGGSDGMPTAETRSLYEFFDFMPYYGDGYLKNPLYQGRDDVPYGFMRLESQHLGGHHLGLRIYDGSMTVLKMALGNVPEKTFLSDLETLDVDQWVASLPQQWLLDHDNFKAFSLPKSPQRKYGWDCPLRRRAFYAGTSDIFHPFLPSSRRSAKIFGNMTDPSVYAHPTQKRMDAHAHLGKYITSNGFCFCPVLDETTNAACQVSLSQNHYCSLQNTIKAVAGVDWVWSYTFLPKTKKNELKKCTLQLDWPFVEGQLRDNTNIIQEGIWARGSDVESKRCHLLDRLHPFQYKYQSVDTLGKLGKTTLDSGVCHTGRVQTFFPTNERCVRIANGLDENTLMCKEDTKTVTRKFSQPVKRRTRFTRQYCNQCSKLPRFESRNQQKMDPETSFGEPYRRSFEKTMAQDIKKAVCKDDPECIRTKLNSATWTKGMFIKTLLQNPQGLFTSQLVAPNIPTRAPRPNDEALWNQPWVFCPTPKALKTGENCSGSIPRQVWKQDRVHSCHVSMKKVLQGQPDPMAKTSICDISSKLTDLCNKMEQAKKLIQSVNCIRSGNKKCAIQEYIYSPSNWDTTNTAFVHQTVEEYYQRMNPSICPASPKLAQVILANGQTLLDCPATPFYAAGLVVNSLRSVVNQVCMMVVYMIGVFSNLMLSLFGSNDLDTYKDQFVATWQEFKRKFRGVTGAVSDMFLDMVLMNGLAGVWIQKFLQNLCTMFNNLLHYLHTVYCRIIVNYIPAFFSSLKDIGTYADVGFGVLNDFIEVIVKNVLPEAMFGMLARGYHAAFQSEFVQQRRQAYASEKRVDFTDGKTLQKDVLTKDQKKATSMSQRAKAALSSLIDSNKEKKAAQAAVSGAAGAAESAGGKYLSIFATGLDMAAQGYQFYQDANTAIKIKEALELLPDYWTLFDFTTFQKVVDEVAIFIASDVFCYQYGQKDDKNQGLLPCDIFQLPSPTPQALQSLMPYATQCWADVQVQDLGVSSIYACTGTSICCQDSFCEEKLLCMQCPAVVDNVLTNTYGCNTMTHQCQCSVPKLTLSRCFSHKDCRDTDATCSLVTSLHDISYGSIRCADCSQESICLISSSTRIGQCICLTSVKTELALCKNNLGEIVKPQASLLCGFSMNPMTTHYYWPDIALVECANVKLPTCVGVWTESSSEFFMVLSNQIQAVTLTTTNRRLLSTDDSLQETLWNNPWNHTSAVCAWVVHDYLVTRAPVSEYPAMQCAYWRQIGMHLIQTYNLSLLRHKGDHFLLSPSDFTQVISQEGVWEELSRHPGIILDIMKMVPWAEPVNALSKYYLPHKLPVLHPKPNKTRQKKPNKTTRKLLSYDFQFVKDTDEYLDTSPQRVPLRFPATITQYFSIRSLGQCFPVDFVYVLGRDIFTKLVFYYKHMNFVVVSVSTSFSFPTTPQQPSKNSRNIISWAVHKVFELFHINFQDIVTYFGSTQVYSLMDSFLYCDVDTLLYCNEKRFNVLPVLCIGIAIFLGLNYLVSPTLSYLFLVNLPGIVMYVSYQISPACVPMVPTCFLDEVLWNIQEYLPTVYQLPAILECNEETCTKTCTELGFQQVQDPLLYVLCEFNQQSLMEKYISVDRICNLANDVPNRDGYRFCALITSVLSLPILMGIVGILVVISALVIFILSLFPSLCVVLFQVVMFNHKKGIDKSLIISGNAEG